MPLEFHAEAHHQPITNRSMATSFLSRSNSLSGIRAMKNGLVLKILSRGLYTFLGDPA
jgi:hypothetical protein